MKKSLARIVAVLLCAAAPVPGGAQQTNSSSPSTLPGTTLEGASYQGQKQFDQTVSGLPDAVPISARLKYPSGGGGGFLSNLRQEFTTSGFLYPAGGAAGLAIAGGILGGPAGAIVGAALGALFGSFAGKTPSRESGFALGGLAGGAILGAAVGGPLGAIVGGILGLIFGKKAGRAMDG